MRNGRRGGLSGKARHARCRARESDGIADEMIAEYLCEDADAEPDRYIPIGRHSEFVPSAAGACEPGQQLELPFGEDGPEAALTFPKRGNGRAATEWQPAVLDTQGAKRPCVVVDGPVASPSRDDAEDLDRPPATLRGFAMGCLLGGAAAVVLLAVVRLVFG